MTADPLVRLEWMAPRLDDDVIALLDAAEAERMHGIRLPADRARFATGRALVKSAVAERWGYPVRSLHLAARSGPGSKPVLWAEGRLVPVAISIAHAGQRVLVATLATDTNTGAEVGVDVEEEAATDFNGFDEVALSPRERQAVLGLPRAERRHARAQRWTRKEAWLKATGRGLSMDPSLVDTAELPVIDLDVGPGYAAALCVLDTGSGAPEETPALELKG